MFIFRGRAIVLKEKTNKVVGWLNCFVVVRNIVANVNFIYIDLLWAGICLLLKVNIYTSK